MSGTLRRVLRTSGLVLAGQLFGRVTGAIVYVSMGRLLGKAELGRFSFVVAYVGIFQVIGDLGLQQIVVREVARGGADRARVVFNAALLRFLLAALACVAVLSLLPWVGAEHRSSEVHWMVFAGCAWILSYAALPLGAVFRATMRMEVPVAANAVGNACYAVLAVLGILVVRQAWAPWLALVLTSVGPALAIAWFGVRTLRPDPRPSAALMRSLATTSWPLALNSLLMVIYNRIDQVMIQHYLGPAELGGYAAAVKLMEIWNVVPFAVMSSIFPLLSRYAGEHAERHREVLERTLELLVIVIVGAVPFMARYGGWLLGLVFGPAFVGAHRTLVILTTAELFLYFLFVFRDSFVSEGRERLVIVFAASTMVVNVLLNLALIPRLGIEGAAWATLVALMGVLVLAFAIRDVRHYGWLALAALVRPAVAAAAASAVLVWLAERPVLSGALALAVYGGVLVLTGAIDRAELALARDVLRRKSPAPPPPGAPSEDG